jgi:hypothetical protein
LKRGVCVKINHFPEDTDYDHDSAEYLLRTWGVKDPGGMTTGAADTWKGRGEGRDWAELEPQV